MAASRNDGVARILTRFYAIAFCSTGHNISMRNGSHRATMM